MNVNFLGFSCNNGYTNMALDEAMLRDVISIEKKSTFVRFYTWSPRCISLGKNQKDIDLSGFDIDVVRRITGGRALLHDNELTYSIAAPIEKGESVLESYKNVSDAIILGMKELGIELEYAGKKTENAQYCMNISCGADISYKGKKLVGSAQFRSQGYFLQHGSILFDADFDFIEKLFGQKVERHSIATIKEINDKISIHDLVKALEFGFYEKFRNKAIV